MTLLQMKYFQAVCTYDSVSLAAQKLHVSQPTISAAIRALEDEFRIRLFDKAGKKLQLTQAGVVFLSLCSGILTDTNEALETMQKMSGENRQVRLGADPTLAAIILPSLYQAFTRENPQSFLYVEENEPQLLMEKLEQKELELILIRDIRPPQDNCRRLHLGNWEYALCVSFKHPLAARDRVSLSELEGLPLIAFPLEVPPYSLPNELYASAGLQPNVVYRSSQLSTIRRMIISNSMGHFTYRMLAESWKNIHTCSLEPPCFQSVSLYWRRDAYLSSDAQSLIRCLKQLREDHSFHIHL